MCALLSPNSNPPSSLGDRCVLVDTVGFIQDLPTDLVHSFRATLEEVRRADVLLHVRDASVEPRVYEAQREAVEETLEELGALGVPTLEVWNKVDKLAFDVRQEGRRGQGLPLPRAAGQGEAARGSRADNDDDEGEGDDAQQEEDEDAGERRTASRRDAVEVFTAPCGMRYPSQEEQGGGRGRKASSLHVGVVADLEDRDGRVEEEDSAREHVVGDQSRAGDGAVAARRAAEAEDRQQHTQELNVFALPEQGPMGKDAIRVSAATGEGMGVLLQTLDALLHLDGDNRRFPPKPLDQYRYVRVLPGQSNQ